MDKAFSIGRSGHRSGIIIPCGLQHRSNKYARMGQYFFVFKVLVLRLFGCLQVIKQFCNESLTSRYNATLTSSQLDIMWSSIVSIFLIGGTIGSLSGSLLADRIGRKGGLAVSSALGVISGLMFWIAKSANSFELLFVGRTFGGLSAGAR